MATVLETHHLDDTTSLDRSRRPVPRPRTPRKRPSKPARPRTRPQTVTSPPTYRIAVTIALGCAIPLLSLTLSSIAGTLARGGHWSLSVFGAVCGVSVLVVSLSHLADAVADLTGASTWQAWLLAITLDLSIVLSELVHVFAYDAGLWAWTLALMTAVAAFSMLLNCHAFLSHRKGVAA